MTPTRSLLASLLYVMLLPLAVSACAPLVPVADLEAAPKAQLEAARKVRILNSSQLVGEKFEVVDIVEGHSCQFKMTDPPATRAGAIEQLRFKAMTAGAEAITNVQCGAKEAASTNTNCWELLSCTAEAL